MTADACTDACLHHKDDDLPDCACYEAGRLAHCSCDGPACPTWTAGYVRGKQAGPFADREAGMFSQTPPAEEAPDSVRVDRPNQLDRFIQFGIMQDGAGAGQGMLCRLLPARNPHKGVMWTCECGSNGTAATPVVAVLDVRRHFWHNHADKKVAA